MKEINVSDVLRESVLKVLAGLLRLGNIELGENPNGDSYVVGVADITRASQLLLCNQSGPCAPPTPPTTSRSPVSPAVVAEAIGTCRRRARSRHWR